MKPVAFAYLRAQSVEEACHALGREGDAARILAGGQSLSAMLNMRIVTPSLLIDINGIGALDFIEENEGGIVTGATVRQAAALRNLSIVKKVPLLAAALPHVGHYQTRGRGTLAGSVAHADPSAEIPLVLTVLGGGVELASRRRRRQVPAREFFISALTTRRAPDEMIVSLRWPPASANDFYGFKEIALRAGDYALVAAACHASQAAAGALGQFTIGFGGCGDHPQIVAHPFSSCTLSAAGVKDLAAETARVVECRSDLHASAAYRRHLAGFLCEELMREALAFFKKGRDCGSVGA
ncbi:MAG TPA: FAD binding domain-containing protein [Hyphomicrobiales bacterium]|nr:FAD binding domain-containing protein [Hyphomicrobiales bacterium]